jgi:glycosyltransferase involved in cell wall biosynthesis
MTLVGKKIRIHIVSHCIPKAGHNGFETYTLDFIKNLSHFNTAIELIWLSNEADADVCWHFIPKELRQCGVRVVARNFITLGHILIRASNFRDFFLTANAFCIHILKLFYRCWPEELKRVYRKIKWSRTSDSQKTEKLEDGKLFGYIPNRDDLSFFKRCLCRFQSQVVVANTLFMAKSFDAIERTEISALKVLLTCSVRHQRAEIFRIQKIPLREIKRYDYATEQTELKKADLIIAIQSEDKAVFEEMVPGKKVLCVPLTANLVEDTTIVQEAGKCLFVGCGALQNQTGLEWFLEKVWPKVIQSVPHASLHICGNVEVRQKRELSGVYFRGWVKDLRREYLSSEICVVPLLIGSGLKTKLVEALSYGKACIVTRVGAQGLMMAVQKEAILRADTEEDFASRVVLLLSNPAIRVDLQQRAKKFISDFSSQKIYQPVWEFFASSVK